MMVKILFHRDYPAWEGVVLKGKGSMDENDCDRLGWDQKGRTQILYYKLQSLKLDSFSRLHSHCGPLILTHNLYLDW